jgi:uncharacterized protein (DUF1499 family)
MSSGESKISNGLVRRIVRKVIVLSVIFVAGLLVMSMTAARPAHLGVHGGKLTRVPDSPNCVASMTEKEAFKADPIDVAGVEQPIEKLKLAIESAIPRSKLVTEDGNYLHYEFTSLLFRFVDDGEFLLDEEQNVIDFRSGSRVGHSDMGTNRKRIEKIRSAIAN